MFKAVLAALLLASASASLTTEELKKVVLARESAKAIPKQFIVQFSDDTEDVEAKAQSLIEGTDAEIVHIYNKVFKGVALKNYEIQESALKATWTQTFHQDEVVTTSLVRQNNPPWGLDRIDQAPRALDNEYRYAQDGTGVKVFVFDTGIRGNHEDLEGRVTCGKNYFPNQNCLRDNNGHGTHVAGTVGGTRSGVAKNAKLVAVKVLGDSGRGSYADIVDAFEWVIARKEASPNTPMVINASLGGPADGLVDRAVNSASTAGVTVVVAAGNDGGLACDTSPAAAASAITVAASNSNDDETLFSNYGSCVDIFAPGEDIVSSCADSTSSYCALDGTSMASPHVAGLAALYLEANPSWSPAQVTSAIKNDGVSGALQFVSANTPNLLASSRALIGDSPPPATNPVPIRRCARKAKRACGCSGGRAVRRACVQDVVDNVCQPVVNVDTYSRKVWRRYKNRLCA